MNFKEFLYFSLFSSVTSAALNTIQISYGMSYFRHRDSSDIFTYDIARQSVVDKMVREISLEVREKSGKSQGICFSHFCGNPATVNSTNTPKPASFAAVIYHVYVKFHMICPEFYIIRVSYAYKLAFALIIH